MSPPSAPPPVPPQTASNNRIVTSERPKKLQRISQACDLCHRRSIRCRPSVENSQNQCQNCFDFAVECTYNRPSRRRKNSAQPSNNTADAAAGSSTTKRREAFSQLSSTSPGSKSQPDIFPSSTDPELTRDSWFNTDDLDLTNAYATIRRDLPPDPLTTAWRAFALSSADAIKEYLHIYMDVVYPVYPLYHGPTLWRSVENQNHLKNRGCFAAIMATCALAAARARDGALGERHSFHDRPAKISEVFFVAAQDAIHQDLANATGIQYLKACLMLTLTGIQYGHTPNTQRYLGMFWTLSGMQAFHDENKWPKGLSVVQKEERRRLYWSMYNLDIYSAVVFGSMMHSQEAHANVCYPSEVDDEHLVGQGSPQVDAEHWLRGQNFITDLYRVLEHIVLRIRRSQPPRQDRIDFSNLLVADGIADGQVMDNVLGLYYQLSPQFKDYSQASSDTSMTKRDYYGFMSANIQFTLQLVRITLFSSTINSGVKAKCDTVDTILSTFQTISPRYLRAISAPLVFQLSSVGKVLASVTEGILSEESYRRVRAGLVAIADVLQDIESGLQPTVGMSRNLRERIDKIDAYMVTQRQLLGTVMLPPHSGMRLPLGSYPYAQPPQPDSVIAAENDFAEASDANRQRIAYVVNNGSTLNVIDEYQLPADLVNNWPWPFDLSGEQGQGQDQSFQPGLQGPGNTFM